MMVKGVRNFAAVIAAISPKGIETGTKSVYDIRNRFFWQHFD
jgi:hypothetical protein